MKKISLLLAGTFLMLPISRAHADHDAFHVTVHPMPFSLTAPSLLQKEEELKRTPGAVNLVSAEQFEHKYARDFKDTLAKTPGVFAQNRFGEEVRLSIRGSGISRGFHLRGVQLLENGSPINLADGGGDFQEIDPANIQYMEVYKGSNALRYGSNTLGGAINVVTPTARTVDYNGLVSVEGGSFGTIRTHLATAQKSKVWDIYASTTLSHADGFREQSTENKGRLNTNIGYKISEDAETRFYLTYNNLNQEVPGSLTRSNALAFRKSAPAINKTNDYQRNIRSVRLMNKTTVQLSSTSKMEFGVFANDKELFHPIFQVLDQQSTDFGGFTRYDKDFTAFGLGHKFMFGANYQNGKTDALQYTNVGGSRGTKTADGDQKSQNVSLYGEGQFHVSTDVSAIIGGQAVYSNREFINNLNPAASDDRSYYQYNPKFGALWDVTPASQIFANVSRSSEVATFSELVQQPVVGFVPLKPQTAWTTEIGTRGTHKNLAWDLTAYRSNIQDELLQFTTNPSIPASTFNAGKTVHQGLELGGSWHFARDVWKTNDAFVLSQIYDFNDFRFDNDPQFGNNEIAGIPRHMLRTELEYRQDKWSVAPNIEWAPEAPYADFANTLKATSYVILNLEAHRKLTDKVDMFVEGRNLLDKNYISNVVTSTNASIGPSPANFYPGEGRGFFAGIKAKF